MTVCSLKEFVANCDCILTFYSATKPNKFETPQIQVLRVRIPARHVLFIKIDHQIVSTVILLLLLSQEGVLSVTEESMRTVLK